MRNLASKIICNCLIFIEIIDNPKFFNALIYHNLFLFQLVNLSCFIYIFFKKLFDLIKKLKISRGALKVDYFIV